MTNSVKSTIVTLTIVIAITISSVASNAAELININTANEVELAMMMRVGPVLAKRIVMYRTDNGPFATVEDLTKVMGIGPRVLEMNRAAITVGTSVPDATTPAVVPVAPVVPVVPAVTN